MHVALYNSRDAFERPTDKEARNNPALAREQIKAEMKYVTNILDELLHNEHLF